MALQQKLDALKKGFEAQAPNEVVEIMHRATEDLKKSGILDGTVKVGDQAPDFSLKNADGQEFSPKDLRSHGSDPGNQVTQRYGLKFQLPEDLKEVYLNFDIDLPRYNGDDSWTLPLPTTLIIDQNGIVQHGAINADYTVRPDPEETLAALKKIVG